MGHLLFIALHLLAILFGFVGLFITLPLHLMYGALSRRPISHPAPNLDQPNPSTHVRCPECRELVRIDASKCKHCGTGLVPQPMPAAVARRSSVPWTLVAVVLVALAAIQVLDLLFSR